MTGVVTKKMAGRDLKLIKISELQCEIGSKEFIVGEKLPTVSTFAGLLYCKFFCGGMVVSSLVHFPPDQVVQAQ